MRRITRGLITLISAASIALFASAAMAENLKVGVVDLHKVMQESSQAKAISQQLEKQFKPRQQKLLAQQKQLKADADKLNRDSSVMTAAQKKQLQNKINAEKGSLQQAAAAYQQELNNAQNKAMQDFFNKVKAALDKIAKQGNYDIILQKEGVPFAADKIDITPQVVKALS